MGGGRRGGERMTTLTVSSTEGEEKGQNKRGEKISPLFLKGEHRCTVYVCVGVMYACMVMVGVCGMRCVCVCVGRCILIVWGVTVISEFPLVGEYLQTPNHESVSVSKWAPEAFPIRPNLF